MGLQTLRTITHQIIMNLYQNLDDDLDIDNPPEMRSEKHAGRITNLLDRLAAEADDRARKDCIRLLRGQLGDGGLRAFLRCPQPDHADLTGDQILTRDPHGLLAKLEALERGAE